MSGKSPQSKRDRSAQAQIIVDAQPRFNLSPYLYMQFMEPLGVTDVELLAKLLARRPGDRNEGAGTDPDALAGRASQLLLSVEGGGRPQVEAKAHAEPDVGRVGEQSGWYP